MSQYPECKHGHSDPNFPCEECKRDGLVALAESLYDSMPIRELREQNKTLTAQIETLRDALKPLVGIANEFIDDGMDEARPSWGDDTAKASPIEIVTNRGGNGLLTLGDCFKAANALQATTPKRE